MKLKLIIGLPLFIVVMVSCNSKATDKTTGKEKPPVSVDVIIASNNDFSNDDIPF